MTPAEAYVAKIMAALGSRDPLDVLDEMPEALSRAVSGLSPALQGTPEGPGKWSVRHVVQHLADSDLVAAYRFRMILAHERPALPGYDQDLWADRLRYRDSDIELALRDFATLRAGILRLIRAATLAELERGMQHAERGEERLSHLIRMHAGHDVVHLRQIARIRRAIGATAV
jgi:DinB superfamily